MNLPITLKLLNWTSPPRWAIEEWITDNDLSDDVVFNWHKLEMTFKNKDDAVIFKLKFQCERKETTIERMLREITEEDERN
jgi:hypothetical protein